MHISSVLLLAVAMGSAMAQVACVESALYSTCSPQVTASKCSNNACYCASIQSLTSCYFSNCPNFVLPTSDLDAVGLYCSTTRTGNAGLPVATTTTTGMAAPTAAMTGTGTTAAAASASTSKGGADGMLLAPAGGLLAVVVVAVAYL